MGSCTMTPPLWAETPPIIIDHVTVLPMTAAGPEALLDRMLAAAFSPSRDARCQ